jgi:hypothetical protein
MITPPSTLTVRDRRMRRPAGQEIGCGAQPHVPEAHVPFIHRIRLVDGGDGCCYNAQALPNENMTARSAGAI